MEEYITAYEYESNVNPRLHRLKRKMRQTFCKKIKNLLFSFSIV